MLPLCLNVDDKYSSAGNGLKKETNTSARMWKMSDNKRLQLETHTIWIKIRYV